MGSSGFELFHCGHLALFKKARSLGDFLIVGVSSDETLIRWWRESGDTTRRPIIPDNQRYEIIKNCKLVDEVVEDAPYETTKEFIIKNKIDLVVRGDSDFLERYKDPVGMGMFRAVGYTEGISTTKIIEEIISRIKS